MADETKCDGCGAVSPFESWADARAAGWYSGTWYPSVGDSDGIATVCPDCHMNDAEPEPR